MHKADPKLILVLAILSCYPLSGQSPTAGVVGIVRDASGAGVPGAAVHVRNTDSNNQREAASDHTGGCAVPSLAAGPYELTVEKPRFQLLHEARLDMQGNYTLQLELRLTKCADADTVGARVCFSR